MEKKPLVTETPRGGGGRGWDLAEDTNLWKEEKTRQRPKDEEWDEYLFFYTFSWSAPGPGAQPQHTAEDEGD